MHQSKYYAIFNVHFTKIHGTDTCTYAHAHTLVRACTNAHTFNHIRTCVDSPMRADPPTRADLPRARTHPRVRTHTHMRTHARMRTHAHMQTHARACIHALINRNRKKCIHESFFLGGVPQMSQHLLVNFDGVLFCYDSWARTI